MEKNISDLIATLKESAKANADSIDKLAEEQKADRDLNAARERINNAIALKSNSLNEQQMVVLKETRDALEGDKLQKIEDKREAIKLAERQIEAIDNIEVKGLDKLANAIQDPGGWLKGIIDTIKNVFGAALTAGLGVLITGGFTAGIGAFISSLTTAIGPLISGFKVFGALLGKLLLPITIAIGLIGAIIGGIKGFKKEGITGAIKGVIIGALDAVVGTLIDSIGGIVKWIGNLVGLGDYANAVVDAFKSIYDTVTGTIGNVIDLIKSLFTGDFEMFKKIINDQISLVMDMIKKVLINLPIEFIKALFKIFKFVGNIPIMVVKALVNLTTVLIKGIGETIKALFITLPGFIGQMIGETFSEGIMMIVNAFKAVFVDFPLMLKDKFVSFFTEFIPSLFEKIGSAVKDGFNSFLDFFLKLPTAISAGIKALAPGGKSPREAFMQALMGDNNNIAKSEAIPDIQKTNELRNSERKSITQFSEAKDLSVGAELDIKQRQINDIKEKRMLETQNNTATNATVVNRGGDQNITNTTINSDRHIDRTAELVPVF